MFSCKCGHDSQNQVASYVDQKWVPISLEECSLVRGKDPVMKDIEERGRLQMSSTLVMVCSAECHVSIVLVHLLVELRRLL